MRWQPLILRMFLKSFNLAAILLAVQFLTRIPLPLRHKPAEEVWAHSVAWFPVVGLLIGLLVAGARYLASWFWPVELAAALSVALWAIVTGSLHLDGFVDCCDALVAVVPAQRRLEILRDVHVGTYGLVGAIVLLLLKWLAVSKAPWSALVIAPIIGRWAMAYVIWRFPYARSDGLGKMFKDGLTWREFLLASFMTLGLALAFMRWQGLIALAGSWLAAWLSARWAHKQLGTGITGDVYGMECEVNEIVALLILGALH
jgi:adenosylcobinamide-GDP ribazoletransferase